MRIGEVIIICNFTMRYQMMDDQTCQFYVVTEQTGGWTADVIRCALYQYFQRMQFMMNIKLEAAEYLKIVQ